jgi:predicted porin
MLKAAAAALATAACVSAPAHAQTALLYGQLNLTLEHINGTNPGGDVPRVQRLSSNASRFGVRGAEPIGGGLVAVWQIESGISADAGGGALASRETYVGIDGDWGVVKLGNFLAPYDDMHAIFGNVPTLTTSILSTAALWSQGGLSKAFGGFDARLGNSLRYDSPEWRGMTGSIQYALGEDARHSGVLGVSVLYDASPFEAGIAYERNYEIRGEDLNDWALTATAGYNFGKVRVAGVYERLRYATPVGQLTRNFWGASATVVAGPGSVYLFYGRADDGKASADVRVGGLASGPDTSADQYVLSYTYPLSTRTLTYAGYVRLANATNASYNFAVNPYVPDTPPPGLKMNGFVLGVVHFF